MLEVSFNARKEAPTDPIIFLKIFLDFTRWNALFIFKGLDNSKILVIYRINITLI